MERSLVSCTDNCLKEPAQSRIPLRKSPVFNWSPEFGIIVGDRRNVLDFQLESCIILPGRDSYKRCISVTEMLVFSQDE